MTAFRLPYAREAFPAIEHRTKSDRRIEDPAHLAFIRKLPSPISGAYGCEACHIRAASAVHRKKPTPAARKPDDAWCLPLTPEEHRTSHAMSELGFWREHGIDPFDLAARLYEISGDIDAGKAIIKEAGKP